MQHHRKSPGTPRVPLRRRCLETLADLREWLDRTPGHWHPAFAIAAWLCILATIIRQLTTKAP
jgi:hypothetical protein